MTELERLKAARDAAEAAWIAALDAYYAALAAQEQEPTDD